MLGYNPEEKRIDNARKNLYRDFVKGRKEILESDLSDIEKQEAISSLLERIDQEINILNGVRSIENIPEEYRESLGIETNSTEVVVDENVVDTLVSIYAKRAKMPSQRPNGIGISEGITLRNDEELEVIDTSAFEEELRQYFTEHYYDLLSDGYNHFLSDVTEVADADSILHEKNGELIEIAIRHNLDPKKFTCFGYQLTVRDGLVAEEDSTLGSSNVFYATPEAVNQRIFDLYSETLFQEQKSKRKDIFTDRGRKLKNTYITYAEKNGFEIQDRDVFEELPVDMKKVQGVASYINRVLNENGTISSDMTERFAAEIQKDYSKIMNLTSFDFGELESVKEIANNKYVLLDLSINEDSILETDEFSPDIAYGTPEYIRDEYRIVMARIKKLSDTDAFASGYLEVEKANKQKEALRRYIRDNGIEGIDISIPEVEVDHKKTEMITDAILNKYGADYKNKEEMRARILKKVEDRYPEMYYERQTIGLSDLVGEELKDMGRSFVTERLYMQNDFGYIGDYSGFNGQCIYATPETIAQQIEVLDEKIATRDFPFDEKRIREQLVQYAKDNQFKIQIPDIESVENRRKSQQYRFSFRGNGLGSFDRDMLPDDPTARKKIELDDSVFDVIYKMSDGLPGAIVGMTELMKSDETGIMLLLGLDDMNIRGSQIWEAYKYLYNEDGKKFADAVRKRDKEMVDFINEELASVGGEKTVTGGASFDRTKSPDKYRFTEEEVEQLKQQREERIAREKEQREKMLTNIPAKKNRGAKKRAEREAKRQEYRQRLIAMGKKSLGELDEELTELQEKEQQAKELCEQYEQQLPDKSHQEI